MGSSRTIMDLFQPAAKRSKLSSPHCCASGNTPNSKPLLQVVSQKLPLSSKSSENSSTTTTSLTAKQQSRIEFNIYLAKSKRNLNDMRCTPGIMSQMPPLPESINEDLANSILPNTSQSTMLSSPIGIQMKQEPRC